MGDYEYQIISLKQTVYEWYLSIMLKAELLMLMVECGKVRRVKLVV